MDIDSIAREIRAKIMDRIEADRCIHASSIEDEIAHVLRMLPAMLTMPAAGHDWPILYRRELAGSYTWFVR